jgi:hypothetical protein
MALSVISLRCNDLSAFGGLADMAGTPVGLVPVENDPKRKFRWTNWIKKWVASSLEAVWSLARRETLQANSDSPFSHRAMRGDSI